MKIDPISILLSENFKIDKKVYFISGNEKTMMQKIKDRIVEKYQKNTNARIINIETIEEAKSFTGKLILLDKKYLPKLKPNQFYFSELEQMEVLINKKKIGYVKHVYFHGAGEYLEIKCNNGELLVPFNFDHIEKINPQKKELHLSVKYYEI